MSQVTYELTIVDPDDTVVCAKNQCTAPVEIVFTPIDDPENDVFCVCKDCAYALFEMGGCGHMFTRYSEGE